MSLFFETSRQANCFLCMLPVGLVAALCLDLSLFTGRIRPLMDVLVLLFAGFAVLMGVVFCRETSLRLYHLLGMMCGAVLYMQGIAKIIRWIKRRKDLKRRMAK